MFDPEVDGSDVGGSDPIHGVIFLPNCQLRLRGERSQLGVCTDHTVVQFGQFGVNCDPFGECFEGNV